MFKKIFSIFAALTLSVGLWAEMVSYRYPEYIDGDVTKGIDMWLTSSKDATPVTSSSSTWGEVGMETWLVVSENVTISQRITCQGDVRLILADDVTLNATQGITVSGEGNSLTIYAQTEDIAHMGQLIADATGGDYGAGIGGGNEGNGSYITINGGLITATSNYGAGIGGGEFGEGSNITINGGVIMATSVSGGAGIGGGSYGSGSNITINGGEVTATGGEYGGTGIGGGSYTSGSNITINGGEVIATGGDRAAGIGGGEHSIGSNITILAGTVTANGGMDAVGIGGGMMGSGSNIFVATSLVIKAGDSPNPTTVITNTGADLADQLEGKSYVTVGPPTPVSTTYIDENGETQTIDAWEVKDASAAVTWGTAGNTTWYVVKGNNVQLAKGAVCAGDVRLILADGAKLTATGGINVTGTNSLTIYGQSTGDEMGQLIADATSVGSAAGIGGGGMMEDGSNITINGGIVEATGGEEGAGIGGGHLGSGSNITINGGEVTATGGIDAAGIGGSYMGSGSYITINGGIVTATGGDAGAAGIGGGSYGAGSYITINGGEVTATGGEEAAGIGGGSYMNGSYITINGGIVTATGGTGYFGAGAGIGGGAEGSGSNIYISDAYILKAGATAEPTEVIAHSSAQDLGGTLTQQYAKVQGLATPYTRSMTIDNWATVCLPYASTVFSGAKFYRVNYYDGDTKLYIEEVSSLEAGMPYIFQATAETVTIDHAGVATLTYGEEQTDSGLHGSFARTIIATDGSQAALSENAVKWLDPGLEITVPACRAYFDMTYVPREEQPHSAPLRCIRVPRQTPTDFENVTLDEDATKILRNGQLIIIRDGKEYNAQGMQL